MKPTKYFKFVLFGDLNDLQFQFGEYIEITNSRIEQLPNILNM